MSKPRKRCKKHIEVDKRTAAALFREFEIGLGRAVLDDHPEDLEALMMLGHALTRAGKHKEALKSDQRIARLVPRDPIAHYNLACSYSNLKDLNHALKSLRRALDLGYRDIAHMMRDVDLKNVRRDPRFRKLIDRKWGKRRSSKP